MICIHVCLSHRISLEIKSGSYFQLLYLLFRICHWVREWLAVKKICIIGFDYHPLPKQRQISNQLFSSWTPTSTDSIYHAMSYRSSCILRKRMNLLTKDRNRIFVVFNCISKEFPRVLIGTLVLSQPN